MASVTVRQNSKSIHCGLCDAKIKILWQCLDCDFYICEKCKIKIHPKLKNANEHRIIECSDHTMEKMDFKSIKCTKHPGKICARYCLACSEVMCEQCEENGHRNHQSMAVSEGFKTLTDKLKDRRKLCQAN